MKSYKEILLEKFFSQNDRPRYIYGINTGTFDVLKELKRGGVKLNGFIDTNTHENQFKKLPVYHDISEIEKEAIVLNCEKDWKPITVRRILDEANLENVDIYAFWKYYSLPIKFEFWEGFEKYYTEHQKGFDRVCELLKDDLSKETFRRLVDFRLNADISAMSIFTDKTDKQYFEDFLDLKEEGESFADIGSYDGKTSLDFIGHCPRFSKIWAFEPGPDLMEKVQRNLSNYQNIIYCPVAASNKKETLYFEYGGIGSKLTDDGDVAVQADKIDEFIKEKVTFMKMDIEGAESMAIEGAKQTILKYHPRLAICVYHRPGDYVDIPTQILSIRDDYDLYLRQYTEVPYETVMFFMPRD